MHNLHDAQSVNWRLELTVPLLWIDKRPEFNPTCTVYLNVDESLDPARMMYICTDLGEISLYDFFADMWNNGTLLHDRAGVYYLNLERVVYIKLRTADGRDTTRSVKTNHSPYRVLQDAWLGQLTPNECRGYIDYLNKDSLTVTHLPVGQIPTTRDERWVRVTEPEKVAVLVRGTLVISEAYTVDINSVFQTVKLDYLRP